MMSLRVLSQLTWDYRNRRLEYASEVDFELQAISTRDYLLFALDHRGRCHPRPAPTRANRTRLLRAEWLPVKIKGVLGASRLFGRS